MKFSHPLMHDNFTKTDMDAAIKLLKKKDKVLTQSINVKLFERRWSKWLGVRYSVFVKLFCINGCENFIEAIYFLTLVIKIIKHDIAAFRSKFERNVY